MNSWILSIVCVVLISSIISLVLPEGKLAKLIKSFFGIIIMFVIIQPIFKLKNQDYNFNLDSYDYEIVFQQNYLDYMVNEKVLALQTSCQEILSENGFKSTLININYISDELGQVEIQEVVVDLKSAVYIYDSRHIDIIDDIISLRSKYLDIQNEQVNVIE